VREPVAHAYSDADTHHVTGDVACVVGATDTAIEDDRAG
jgi:hypothetical protein